MSPELQPTEKAQEVPVMPMAPHYPVLQEEMHQAPLHRACLPSCHGTSVRAVHTLWKRSLVSMCKPCS